MVLGVALASSILAAGLLVLARVLAHRWSRTMTPEERQALRQRLLETRPVQNLTDLNARIAALGDARDLYRRPLLLPLDVLLAPILALALGAWIWWLSRPTAWGLMMPGLYLAADWAEDWLLWRLLAPGTRAQAADARLLRLATLAKLSALAASGMSILVLAAWALAQRIL